MTVSTFVVSTLLLVGVVSAALSDLQTLPAGIHYQNGKTYLQEATMRNFFGAGCALTQSCSSVSNTKLSPYIATVDVPPLGRVTGFTPVIDRLKLAMQAVQSGNPALYAVLRTAGMLCCRAIRGSTTRFSNHAFGAAIDFTISGNLDPRGDNKAQAGLLQLYPYMAAQGFYWGAGFTGASEDAMHFEMSNEVMTTILNGLGNGGGVNPACKSAPWPTRRTGSPIPPSTPETVALQMMLNYNGKTLGTDGLFGSGTDAAVKQFQTAQRLTSDGIVGDGTWKALWPTTLTARLNSAGWHASAVAYLLTNKFSVSGLSTNYGPTFTLSSTGVSGLNTQKDDSGFDSDGVVDQATFQSLLTECTGEHPGFAFYTDSSPNTNPNDTFFDTDYTDSEPVPTDPTTDPNTDAASGLAVSMLLLVIFTVYAIMA